MATTLNIGTMSTTNQDIFHMSECDQEPKTLGLRLSRRNSKDFSQPQDHFTFREEISINSEPQYVRFSLLEKGTKEIPQLGDCRIRQMGEYVKETTDTGEKNAPSKCKLRVVVEGNNEFSVKTTKSLIEDFIENRKRSMARRISLSDAGLPTGLTGDDSVKVISDAEKIDFDIYGWEKNCK